jgi:hypothetical protein
MTSVPPYGIRVPMLLGGAQAAALATRAVQVGAWTRAPSATELGVASAIKMSRSVMIKGLEALVIESYATARAYGVEDHVLPTLQETFPSPSTGSAQGAYFFSRVVQHGKRRAEEMREAANTVQRGRFRAADGLGHRRQAAVGGRPGRRSVAFTCAGPGRPLAGLRGRTDRPHRVAQALTQGLAAHA